MARNGTHGTLGVISFGLAVAITSAAFTFFLGLMATFFGWGVELAGALSSLYIGFSPTFVGTITGAVWAFVDGFVAGVMIAWLYTRSLAYCPVTPSPVCRKNPGFFSTPPGFLSCPIPPRFAASGANSGANFRVSFPPPPRWPRVDSACQ